MSLVSDDIRSSFAGLSGTADGVALSIVLSIVSASTCAPLANYAVYIWHCGRLGRYSLLAGRDQPELSARRPGGGRQRERHVHVDLPRLLRGTQRREPSRVSLASDMVFSDGSALELATIGGSVSGGLTATLPVAV